MLKTPYTDGHKTKKGYGLQKTEKILCIHKNKLPKEWMSQTAVIPMDLDAFVHTCTRAGYDFVLRKDAENDPSLQQVIPYIVLQTQDLGLTAVYNRQGSETRLHDLWSAGIGGHINPIDTKDAHSTFADILVSGMTRELDEELAKRPENVLPVFCGIINENITEVGRVHLGAVFQILTPEPEAYVPGPELSMFQWQPTDSVKKLQLELWSTLALELVESC